MRSDFFQSSPAIALTAAPELSIQFKKIAQYRLSEDGSYEIHFFSPSLARGLYEVNYERLKELKKNRTLEEKEGQELQQMIRWMELINVRKNLLYRILKILPQFQKTFFESEDGSKRIPLSQKEAARELKVTPPAVCKAIQGRSVELPNGKEISLIHFFPSRKDLLKDKIEELLLSHPEYTDEQFRVKIAEQFGSSLSRRSVNMYRKEILKPNKLNTKKDVVKN
jgi:DNA-directed RNA polymerase specialized sigma54-like protein